MTKGTPPQERPSQPTQPTSWGKYFTSSRSFIRVPQNQFDHAWQLLYSKGRKVEDQEDLMDPNAFLGFIDSDNLLRFYQNDCIFLENLFAMARKHEPLMEVFKVLFHAWIFEIRLTSNKGGIERRLQHSFGGGMTADGFGKVLDQLERRRQEDALKRELESGQGGIYQ